MDADGHIIPLVEDDQGEGIKDFMDDSERLARALTEEENRGSLASFVQPTLEKGKTENEMLQLILDKVERLERLIDQIFDGHILMNGRFTKI